MSPETLLYYGVWFGGSALAAWLGHRQGRNPLTCFVASVVVTPVLALPVLLWLGKAKSTNPPK
ncbi:MAG: hypothetical protein AAGC57_02115 [Pseudomonadota bacterium]